MAETPVREPSDLGGKTVAERWMLGEEREARFDRERRMKMEMKQRSHNRGKRESLLGGVVAISHNFSAMVEMRLLPKFKVFFLFQFEFSIFFFFLSFDIILFRTIIRNYKEPQNRRRKG